MAEVEVSADAPAWMLALEKKRQRVHRLAHEVGAGSRCLLCEDGCPGLDLHFWRKICRNCKCKKEDHDVVDDCGSEQFEILLGSGHSNHRPQKAFLEMLEKHTIAGLKSKAKNVAFDWIPPDISPVVAAEYMQSLPACKLPISGSDGALYRRQQLERQLPLHDLDATQCHQLTEAEVENLNKYLENLKNNVVGQGRVTKLGFPSSNSLDSLQKMCTFNSIPKPFQTNNGSTLSSNPSPQFTVGDKVNIDKVVNLKPPSAFWPKSLSPEPPRSLSPASEAPLPSVADRGAAFGVMLSPAKKSVPSERGRSSPLENCAQQQYVGGHLVKEQVPKSLAQSADVQVNMWVPAECEECCRRAMGGQLIRDQVCTHVAKSDVAPIQVQPSECSACIKKSLDSQLVREQIVCTHLADSIISEVQPMACSECIKIGVDGQLVQGKVCKHTANSSIQSIMQPMTCSDCIKKGLARHSVLDQTCTHFADSNIPHLSKLEECSECFQGNADGRLIQDQVCKHTAFEEITPPQGEPLQSFALGGFANKVPKDTDSQLPVFGRSTNFQHTYSQVPDGSSSPKHLSFSNPALRTPIQTGSFSVPLQEKNSGSSLPIQGNSTTHAVAPHVQGFTVLSDPKAPPCVNHTKPALCVTRDKSPSSMMSSPGAPHMMALYAHNALNSPSSLDPQDALSPYIASMLIDDTQSVPAVDSDVKQSGDSMPLVDTKLECVHCEEDILPGEVVVFADRAGTDVVWHPKCFVCNTCQELLVDLVYFFNKGHVYCGRHYAEILDIPRCSACDELIFVKEYTVAEGQAFHVRHFCCFECDNPLGGKQYVPKDGQPVCIPCFERKYGKQCETCHQVIKAQDQGVTWKDLHWHATRECFCCNHCNISLLGGRFAVKDLRPFCSKECMQGGTSNQPKVSAL